MAETGHAQPHRRPDADAYRRGGLTRDEARRRERVEAWRADTGSPWEASPPGLVLWLLWRALYKGLQPFALIACLLAAGWFGSQWMGSVGGISAIADPAPGQAERLSAAIAASLHDGIDRDAYWADMMDRALDGDRRRRRTSTASGPGWRSGPIWWAGTVSRCS